MKKHLACIVIVLLVAFFILSGCESKKAKREAAEKEKALMTLYDISDRLQAMAEDCEFAYKHADDEEGMIEELSIQKSKCEDMRTEINDVIYVFEDHSTDIDWRD